MRTVFGLELLLLGLGVATLVFLLEGGHFPFLPLLLVFPLGILGGRRRRRG
jgi:hypothetical protein